MAELVGVNRLERLFRRAAGLDVDKSDLRRLNDFLNRTVGRLLLVGQETASANARDVIQLEDLPITQGLQERIEEFRILDSQLEMESILEDVVALPMLDLEYAAETEESLPEIAGGLIVGLAKTFKAIHPKLKNPGSDEWAEAEEIFELLI